MPVCNICEGDGVLEALGRWYCIDHIEEGVLDVVEYVAQVRGWDVEACVTAISDWFDA